MYIIQDIRLFNKCNHYNYFYKIKRKENGRFYLPIGISKEDIVNLGFKVFINIDNIYNEISLDKVSIFYDKEVDKYYLLIDEIEDLGIDEIYLIFKAKNDKSCGKCAGTNQMADWDIDKNGIFKKVEEKEMYLEQLKKGLLTPYGSHLFYEFYGTEIYRLIGEYNYYLFIYNLTFQIHNIVNFLLKNIYLLEEIFGDIYRDTDILINANIVDIVKKEENGIVSYILKVSVIFSDGYQTTFELLV